MLFSINRPSDRNNEDCSLFCQHNFSVNDVQTRLWFCQPHTIEIEYLLRKVSATYRTYVPYFP